MADDHKRILVTGAAGFIGSYVSRALLERGHAVRGIDNFSPYYDPQLKRDRLAQLPTRAGFSFDTIDIVDRDGLQKAFEAAKPDIVVHLAAQVGVRYSLENPQAFVDANLVGFANVLEECRRLEVERLVYASSSSVYGRTKEVPFSEKQPVNEPTNLYAATKRANELLADTYAYLYDLASIGLRFFTVYGPWGRPDMAYFKFTRLLYEGQPLPLYNRGNLSRDMTYIDDIVAGVLAAIESNSSGHRVYNLGNHEAVRLRELVRLLESLTGRQATTKELPMQPGDMLDTYADNTVANRDLGYAPTTSINEGLANFVNWYRKYYKLAV